jgi:hypothetical protein
VERILVVGVAGLFHDPEIGNVAYQNPSSDALSYFLFPILTSNLDGLKIKNPSHKWKGFWWSGWQDSNLRPPAPKAGAITGLRYTPKRKHKKSRFLFEGANIGFKFFFTNENENKITLFDNY